MAEEEPTPAGKGTAKAKGAAGAAKGAAKAGKSIAKGASTGGAAGAGVAAAKVVAKSKVGRYLIVGILLLSIIQVLLEVTTFVGMLGVSQSNDDQNSASVHAAAGNGGSPTGGPQGGSFYDAEEGASERTGVPWQILAATIYYESGPGQSVAQSSGQCPATPSTTQPDGKKSVPLPCPAVSQGAGNNPQQSKSNPYGISGGAFDKPDDIQASSDWVAGQLLNELHKQNDASPAFNAGEQESQDETNDKAGGSSGSGGSSKKSGGSGFSGSGHSQNSIDTSDPSYQANQKAYMAALAKLQVNGNSQQLDTNIYALAMQWYLGKTAPINCNPGGGGAGSSGAGATQTMSAPAPPPAGGAPSPGGPPGPGGSPTIMGPPTLTPEQIYGFWVSQHKPPTVNNIPIQQVISWYIQIGNAEGVRGDVAFAQALQETGYFTNPDTLQRNNFAGIGHCDTCAKGNGFPSVQIGVQAQIQSLKNAATNNTAPFVIQPPFAVHWGGGGPEPRWENLTGKWASNPDYWPAISQIYTKMLGGQPMPLGNVGGLSSTGGGSGGSCTSSGGGGPPGGPVNLPPGMLGAFIQAAMSQIGKPYFFGGGHGSTPPVPSGQAHPGNGCPVNGVNGQGVKCITTQNIGQPGWDCSGLVNYAAWQVGVHDLNSTAGGEMNTLKTKPGFVTNEAQLQPGDIAFWKADGTPDNPGHVTIYIGGGNFVQAYETGTQVQVSPAAVLEHSGFVGGGPPS